MIFAKTLTVPANTVESMPRTFTWQLVKGLFYKIEVFFPPGPSGLVGVRLNTASHTIYPADGDEWFLGDNVTISFDDEYLFDIETKQVEILAYNNDTVFDHTIQVRLGIISDDAIIKSHYGYADIDRLIITLQALTAVLQISNAISGKFDTSVLG